VLDDRGKVDVLDVVLPVDDAGVEGEGLAVALAQTVEEREGAVDAESGFGLGVGAVELHVFEGALGLCSPILDAADEFGPLPAHGQHVDGSLCRLEHARGTAQLALYLASARERPLRHDDRLPAGVVEGPSGEPHLREVDEGAVEEGVSRAGSDLVDGRAFWRGPVGGYRDDCGHDEVHGDDVDDALRHARELPQQAAGIRDEDRLGHAEASDPAGLRLGEGGLDDGRANEGDGDVASSLEQSAFAERFRIGVGVRPAKPSGAGAAGRDHPVLHPVFSEPLRLVGQERGARGAELRASGLVKGGEAIGRPALSVGVGSRSPGGRDLGSPIRVRQPPARRDELLEGVAFVAAVDIGRRHGDEVGERAVMFRACLPDGLGDAARTEQVHLDGTVEGGVEADGCSRVDDDVAAGEHFPAGLVEVETVSPHVAGDRHEPPLDLGLEAFAELGPQAVEAVVAQDLPPCAVGRRQPLTRSHEYDDLAVGHTAQQALDEGGPKEAGCPSDGNSLPGEIVCDHRQDYFFNQALSLLVGSGSGCTVGGVCRCGLGGV
jgi:hypothetical protein